MGPFLPSSLDNALKVSTVLCPWGDGHFDGRPVSKCRRQNYWPLPRTMVTVPEPCDRLLLTTSAAAPPSQRDLGGEVTVAVYSTDCGRG
ncbi:hypothetical protein ACOMHN_049022 [Nucella lapillus]